MITPCSVNVSGRLRRPHQLDVAKCDFELANSSSLTSKMKSPDGLFLDFAIEFGSEDRNIGGPGTGKTHLATAIAVAGIAAKGKRVRFYSTVDLVNVLEREKRDGKAGRLALSLLRMDLVILDELG